MDLHLTMRQVNRNPTRPTHKGIHAHFDAEGNLIGDERWQLVEAPGAVRYDAEITRPAPFPEPRRESWTFALREDASGRWLPDSLTLRTTTDREARLDWLPSDAGLELLLCWRAGSTTRRAQRASTQGAGALLVSPFSISALLRGGFSPDEHFDIVMVDAVDFGPRFVHARLRWAGRVERDTLGGRRLLEVIDIQVDGSANSDRATLDDRGLVREWERRDGGRARLMALSDP